MDRDGLIVADMATLTPPQARLARDPAEVADWGARDLLGTVQAVRPTVLIGASGQAGSFTEAVVRAMAASCPRPVIFPLSNPVSRAEAPPADLLAWTDGRALVGTGSPFGVAGVTQVNNVYIFPGVGLGAIAAGAHRVTDGMFMAAARALGAMGGEGDTLLPPIAALREVALGIAVAVARAAVADGVASVAAEELTEERIAALMWQAVYS